LYESKRMKMTQANINTFDKGALAYDDWFNRHAVFFQNEQRAILQALPEKGLGVEIGSGTGRFTKALNISIGVEPAAGMAKLAIARGINVVKADACSMPFHDHSFDYAIMVTTVCFLDDIPKAFAEVYRIVKNEGYFIVAIIDKDSEMGKKYEAKKSASPWYRDAHFHSVAEITELLKRSGFTNFHFWQTLFTDKEQSEEPIPGFGEGSFVVIQSQKK
jgi:ubiquinone/menaquinone biosynthesis C-methylase UbiE